MLEPYEGKLSRTVLKGEKGSNPPDLLDRTVRYRAVPCFDTQRCIGGIFSYPSE
ncbi:MAG: hypothetical protein WD398_02970 [Cyclobacteriaceae bacterium]